MNLLLKKHIDGIQFGGATVDFLGQAFFFCPAYRDLAQGRQFNTFPWNCNKINYY